MNNGRTGEFRVGFNLELLMASCENVSSRSFCSPWGCWPISPVGDASLLSLTVYSTWFSSLGLFSISFTGPLLPLSFFLDCCSPVSFSPTTFPWTQHPRPENQHPPQFRWSQPLFRFWTPCRHLQLPQDISSWIILHFTLSMFNMRTIKFFLMKCSSFLNFHLIHVPCQFFLLNSSSIRSFLSFSCSTIIQAFISLSSHQWAFAITFSSVLIQSVFL